MHWVAGRTLPLIDAIGELYPDWLDRTLHQAVTNQCTPGFRARNTSASMPAKRPLPQSVRHRRHFEQLVLRRVEQRH